MIKAKASKARAEAESSRSRPLDEGSDDDYKEEGESGSTRKRRRTTLLTEEDEEQEEEGEREKQRRLAKRKKSKGKTKVTGPDMDSELSASSLIAASHTVPSKIKRKEPAADDKGSTVSVYTKEHDTEHSPITQGMEVNVTKWEASVLRLRAESLKGDAEQEQAARELEVAYIGSAHLRFGGLGDIFGVVNLAEDPNARGNPRGLSISHVDKLFQSIRLPNGKKDHEAPIAVAVPARLLSAKLIEAMKNSDATNILSQPPALVLKSATSEEEQRLENELFLKRRGDLWLPNEELHQIKARLDELRASKELAKLFNGNHRIRAILKRSEEVDAQRAQIRTLIEKGETPTEDIEDMMSEWLENAERLTWRCHVYDSDKLTKTAENALTRNEHSKPAKGMGSGERAWWLAQKFNGEIAEEIKTGKDGDEEGEVDYPIAAGIVQGRWRKELGMKMSMDEDEEADGDNDLKYHSKNKQLGDLAGKDPASRLFFNPVGMEMMLECCPALWAIDKTLDLTTATEMLRPSGGPLVAHFWLSLQTLIQIFNVADGEDLQIGEDYLTAHPTLTANGDPGAVPFYQSLHARPLRVPPLLSLFQDKESAKFGDLYLKAIEPHTKKLRCLDYRDRSVVASLRGVFDQFGMYMHSETNLRKRLVAASLRLYARLPLYKNGGQGPMFYPAAILPSIAINKTLYERWAGGWGVGTSGDSLIVLEELLQRGQLVWTLGAQGTSNCCNWQNWYHRSRGLHQIVLLFWQAVQIGSPEARLSEAIMVFEDPRLSMALHSVDELMSERKPLRNAIQDFCAMKTAQFHYEGARKMFAEHSSNLGRWENFAGTMTKVRSEVKRAIAWEASPSQSWIAEVISKYEVLGMIHPTFWERAFPLWFTGWNDAEAKRMGTVGAGLGWGLLEAWFVDREMPALFRNKKIRWLLEVAQKVVNRTNRKWWWEHRFDIWDLPELPGELPARMLIISRAAARKLESERKKEAAAKMKLEKATAEKATAEKAAAEHTDVDMDEEEEEEEEEETARKAADEFGSGKSNRRPSKTGSSCSRASKQPLPSNPTSNIFKNKGPHNQLSEDAQLLTCVVTEAGEEELRQTLISSIATAAPSQLVTLKVLLDPLVSATLNSRREKPSFQLKIES
ncbi:hypothetical protein FRC12_019398 [Ceratobasidium sp. 428]|nr:hypothetical protein FRC12_019398 [Ceratobasidium sp. 428]